MIQAKIAFEPQEDARSEERAEVDTDVSLRLGAHWDDARLINISSKGFMAEAYSEVFPGSRIWLLLPGIGRVQAQVIWIRGSRVGGSFLEPIDPLRVLQAIGEERVVR